MMFNSKRWPGILSIAKHIFLKLSYMQDLISIQALTLKDWKKIYETHTHNICATAHVQMQTVS